MCKYKFKEKPVVIDDSVDGLLAISGPGRSGLTKQQKLIANYHKMQRDHLALEKGQLQVPVDF